MTFSDDTLETPRGRRIVLRVLSLALRAVLMVVLVGILISGRFIPTRRWAAASRRVRGWGTRARGAFSRAF